MASKALDTTSLSIDRLFVGHCLIDPLSLTIQSKRGQTTIEPKVMALLQLLAEKPNQTWTREEIIARIWPNLSAGDESLTRLVSLLRKAFRDPHGVHPIVKTVPKTGYRLDIKIRRETSKPNPKLSTLRAQNSVSIADFSIAIMPVEGTSLGLDSRFLAEGMTRDLTSLLNRTPRLRVAPYSSSMFHIQDHKSPQELAEALGVRYLVESVLSRQDQAIRLRIELLDTATEELVWSAKYDATLDQFFDIQDEVILSISTAISSKVKSEVYTLERNDGTFNLRAYERVQAAQALLLNYSREAAKEIEEHLEDALAQEPDNAIARAALAVQLSQTVVSQWTDIPEIMSARADRYIAQALSKAATDPEVIAAAGIVNAMFHRPDEAITFLERAVSLDPNNANALAVLGWQRCLRHADPIGIEMIKNAEARAPHHHRYGLWATYRCTAHIFLLDWANAVPACHEAVSRTPNYYQPYLSLAWALAGQGDMKRARISARRALNFGITDIVNRYVEEMRKWSCNSPNHEACHDVLKRLQEFVG